MTEWRVFGLAMRRFLILTLGACAAWAQHGVVREYAALSPKPGAKPLAPLFDAPLTDVSICLGPDRAFYLTGSAAGASGAVYSRQASIWRSPDMRQWRLLRTISLPAPARSPEIHFLKGTFYLTAGLEGGGTVLLKFEPGDLANSAHRHVRITVRGEDPSLFLDDDGTFYWVMGGGEVARMKPDPMDGLAAEPAAVVEPLTGDVRSVAMRGAFLAKVGGFYHLFVAERRLRHGDLGRLGEPGGTDDTWVAVSGKPDSGYTRQRYLAFPHAGQTTLFRGPGGALWATYSCTDHRGVFRLKPGAFRVEQVDATKPVWPIGFDFDKPDPPVKYRPAGILLRPDTSSLYEGGPVAALQPAAMDPVPGQRAPFPWIRDTSITRGGDGVYFMTGTSGNMDAIHLWRSRDLRRFEYVKPVFTLDGSKPELWYNQAPRRLLWAPEIHYFDRNFWLTWCVNNRLGMGLLKSTTGRPEGPYAPTYEGNRAFLAPQIDASLFQDEDGTPYFVWQGRFLRRLKRDLSGFDGDTVELLTADGEQVGYEGIFLRKIGRWYVVLAAEWNGGGNRQDGTYDMMYAVSRKLTGPYSRRRAGVPHGGHSTLFQDERGCWYLAFFGNDRTAPFRAMPGIVPLEIEDAGEDLLIRPGRVPSPVKTRPAPAGPLRTPAATETVGSAWWSTLAACTRRSWWPADWSPAPPSASG